MRLASLPALLLFSGLALASCAKQKEPSRSSNQPKEASASWQVQATASFTDALQLVAKAEVSCADVASCKVPVGMLITADRAGGVMEDSDVVIYCTATLVGEDLALTSSHCIPQVIKLFPGLCPHRMRFVLPTPGGGSESFACKSVLGFSERANPLSPDLALLRLERASGRSPLKASRAGVFPGSSLTFFKITPNKEQSTGILSQEACTAVANSYRMPLYQSEKSSTFVLADCTAKPGNSGGPLVNEAGELVGLEQAELEISESARSTWAPHLADKNGFAKLALGTSLGCLTSDLPAWNWDPACTTIEELDLAKARPRLREQLSRLEPKAQALLAPYASQVPGLEWKRVEVRTTPLERSELLLPHCWNPGQALPGNLPTEIELRQPSLLLELQFNRYLQPQDPIARIKEIYSKRYLVNSGRLTPLDPYSYDGEIGACL